MTTYSYDIHGIVSVVSDGYLPELEAFRTEAAIDAPTIRVKIGTASRRKAIERGEIVYHDGMGWSGFSIVINHGETIEILASPLLRRSPHVLYTNVVEPVLRWTFVTKGYALVHAACLAFGTDAFLITARTDTGKTTTILRVLDNDAEAHFVSDDLTLVSPDGEVMTYPKPLTISAHTVAAVRAPLLSRRERFTLPVQSRLHSKSGRQFGLLLTRSGMPMATFNAIVQWMIPPPKYAVQRLVPGAKLATRAKLAGMIVIERGTDEGERSLSSQEALDILMTNSEDSFGFPPYPIIKDRLYGATGSDLRPVERATVEAALRGVPATLMRSVERNWWQRVPGFAASAIQRPVAQGLLDPIGGWNPGLAGGFASSMEGGSD